MKKYNIEVLQTLRKVISVEADNYENALASAHDQVESGEIQLEGCHEADSWLEFDAGREIEQEIEKDSKNFNEEQEGKKIMNETKFNWSGMRYEDWIKEKLEDALFDQEEMVSYGCELGYTLAESENMDGTLFYSTYQTKEFIKNFFDEAGETFEYLRSELDMVVNPFDEPEKLSVCMLIKAYEDSLSKSEYVTNHWDEEITLTKDILYVIMDDLGIELDENVNIDEIREVLEKEENNQEQ